MTSASGSINGSGLVTSDTVNLTAFSGVGNTTFVSLSSSTITSDTASGDLELENSLATAVNVSSLTTGSGSVSFSQSGGGDLSTSVVSASGAVAVTNATGSISLAGTVVGDSLDASATGSITDGSGGDLAIAGLAEFTAGSVELGNDAGNVTNFGTLTFTSAGSVMIGEDSSLDLVGDNTAGSADLDSNASVSDAGATSLNVTGLLDVFGTSIVLGSGGTVFNAGTLTFTSAGSVSIAESSSMSISGVSTAGAGLNLVSTGDVTLNESVTVVGDTSIVAGTTSGGISVNAKLDGSGTILLDAADEITINAAIDPTTVTLNADDDITVNASVVASALITVSAGEDGSGSFILGAAGSLETTGIAVTFPSRPVRLVVTLL